MLKIVIAEDAAIEREGLIRSIDWVGLGMELAAAADDGQMAWEFVQLHRPDILLTDIKMPLMDGIQLAKQVNEQYPATKIIFISGHEDFNFALEAIKSKVCEYILKPYTIGEMTNALRTVADLCVKEQNKLREEAFMRSGWEESQAHRQEQLFKALLLGVQSHEAAPEALGFRNPKNGYVLMLVRFMAPAEEGETDDIILQRASLLFQGMVNENAAILHGCKLLMIKEGEFLLLRNDDLQALHDKAEIERIGLHLHDWIKSRLNVEPAIGVSNPVADPNRLAECYKETLQALKLGMILGKVPVRFYADLDAAETLTRMDAIVKKAQRMISKRYMESITLNDIANEVFMSPNYLNMIFKKVTGKNINKYLIEFRVNRAIEQLQEADAVISRIAANVGYKNIAHFSTVFKKHTGLSPMEFRDKHVRIRNKS